MKRLTYLTIAERELTEAALYYEERQPGLGRRFLDAVREGEEELRCHADRWAFFEQPVRSFRLPAFPYRLLYRELPDRIQIVAVMHLSRRPDYWKDRLA